VVGQSTTTPAGGRQYARRRFRLPAICAECEVAPAVDRHHWDGNPLNNAPTNLYPVCRACHLRIDGRIEAMRERIARMQAASRGAKLGRATCSNGHPWTPETTYTHPGISGRICRVCAAENAARRRKEGKR
jgi:uncharacterized protein YlaI